MARQTPRASPAAIRRAMAMFAPLDRPPILARKAKPADAQQPDLEATRTVERAAVHVHDNVDTEKS